MPLKTVPKLGLRERPEATNALGEFGNRRAVAIGTRAYQVWQSGAGFRHPTGAPFWYRVGAVFANKLGAVKPHLNEWGHFGWEGLALVGVRGHIAPNFANRCTRRSRFFAEPCCASSKCRRPCKLHMLGMSNQGAAVYNLSTYRDCMDRHLPQQCLKLSCTQVLV